MIDAGSTRIVRKTISLTDRQDQWVKAQIAAGDYTNESEYLRDLIRRDQERGERLLKLKQATREGLDSGVSDRIVPRVIDEVEARLRADGKL